MKDTAWGNLAFCVASAAAASALFWLPAPAPAAAAAGDAAANPLVVKYSCQACHAVDRKLVGPAYREVAAKYAGDTEALAKLQLKVSNGGSGAWGPIPMPPNNVPDADLEALVTWILAQK